MQFVCRVGTPDGQVVEIVHDGADAKSLRAELEKRGLHVFDVRRRGLLASIDLPGLRRRQQVPMRTLLVFNQELAALLRSGLPLVNALDMMAERQTDASFGPVLEAVRDKVKSGESISAAVAGYPESFPALYAPTLQAGERSGELEGVLRRFIRYQKLLLEVRKKVTSALVYPTVLVGLSMVLILVMTVYVMPRFQDFFVDLKADLPLITRITMGFSTFMQRNAPLVLLVVVAGGLFLYSWKRTVKGRIVLDRWKLRLPLLGTIYHRLALSEFCRSLATLLGGGIPIVPALEASVGAVGNAYTRSRLQLVPGQVKEGKALAEALEGTESATRIAIDMVRVGEATGALESMLAEVSDFLDEQVDTRLQRVLSLLEPMMLVAMGLVVAVLLISVYLPLYSLLGNVGP